MTSFARYAIPTARRRSRAWSLSALASSRGSSSSSGGGPTTNAAPSARPCWKSSACRSFKTSPRVAAGGACTAAPLPSTSSRLSRRARALRLQPSAGDTRLRQPLPAIRRSRGSGVCRHSIRVRHHPGFHRGFAPGDRSSVRLRFRAGVIDTSVPRTTIRRCG